MTTRTRLLAAVFLLAGAGAVVLLEPIHGPVLLTLTRAHGIDAGDLLTLPLVLLALWSIVPGGAHRRLAGFPVGVALVVIAAIDLSGATDHLDAAVAYAIPAGILILGIAVAAVLARPFSVRPRGGPLGAAVTVSWLIAGYLIDVIASPSGTVVGPTLLAARLAYTHRHDRGRSGYIAVLGALILVDIAAVADVAGLDILLAERGGGDARTMALGAVLAVDALCDYFVGGPATSVDR